MRWWEVRFNIPSESTEAISALLQEFPEVQGVQIEGAGAPQKPMHPEYGEWFEEGLLDTRNSTISVYVPESVAESTLRNRVSDAISRVREANLETDGAIQTLTVRLMDESEWESAWKEHYDPIPVGKSLLILPAWLDDTDQSQDGRKILLLEPGMAFGTGTHETTRLCMECLEDADVRDRHVLDVGCGTGVLAITAAKLGASYVMASDIDPVAVESAKQNVVINQVENVVAVQEGDLLDGFAENAKFDVVVANILRDIVILLTPQVLSRLAPGGIFITSGYVKTQEAMVHAALEKAGLHIEKTVYKKDWVATVAVKPA